MLKFFRIHKILKQVSGKEGLLSRINQRHVRALTKVAENPNDEEAVRSLFDVLRREKRVINYCIDGLKGFRSILDEFKPLAKRIYKRNVIDQIEYLNQVIINIQESLAQLIMRQDKEEVMISFDIVSLFTNASIDETINLCVSAWNNRFGISNIRSNKF